MSFDVWSELVDMRERIAVMETTLLDIRRVLDKQPTSSGSIVVPVALITAVIQGSVALFQHFT
jgi:hypothetical protein